ncbi:MAG TPA: hypothetical protein DEH25_05900, partial [Chloroflexi bacterium]|nr:hypothetical protein [Chloroflexota bacterium]
MTTEDDELRAELERTKAELAALQRQFAQTQAGALAQGNDNQAGDLVTGAKINQEAGDDALQIGQVRDVNHHAANSTHVQTEGGAAVMGDVDTQGGDAVMRDKITAEKMIIVTEGGKVVFGDDRVEMPAVNRKTALGRYLEHVIAHNRYLQHQGIRSGGRLVNVELDQIYITLRATQQRTRLAEESREIEEHWLAEEAALAPGERFKHGMERRLSETVNVRVEQALNDHRHLVVLGDPGSGKTTLLRYLALTFARDRAEGTTLVQDRLCLEENGYLPILLPLRNLGAFLKSRYPQYDGVEGPERLLEFLRSYLKGERLKIQDDFFDADLSAGKAV